MINLRAELHVINEDNMIYKIVDYREIDCDTYGLCYTLELVAGYDYINPDYSNAQGFVEAENFIDDVQAEWLTVYPLEESLGERLEEEGYKVINIQDYKIHKIIEA